MAGPSWLSPSTSPGPADSLHRPCSIRKERKVRPGYTPVEDIARYRPPASRDSAPSPRPRAVPGLGASVLAALGQPITRPGVRAGSGRPQGAATPPRAAAVASWKTSAPVDERPQRVAAAGVFEGNAKEPLVPAAAVARAPALKDEPRESWDASSDEGEGDEPAGEAEGARGAHDALDTPGGSRAPVVELEATPTPEESERRARALRKKLRQVRPLLTLSALSLVRTC